MKAKVCPICNGSGFHPMTTSTHCPLCLGVGIPLTPPKSDQTPNTTDEKEADR